MRSKRLGVWLLGCTLVLVGCARCGKAPSAAASGLLAHVPRTAQGVVAIPDVRRLGAALSRLQGMQLASFAAQLQGFASAPAFVDALVAQAGVDPRSPESLKKAGLAPERGLAVVALSRTRSLAVLGVSDQAAFERWLEAQARNRLGTAKTTHSNQGGVALTVFAGPTGAPLLAVAFTGGYALIAQGEAISALGQEAQLKAGDSLSGDAAFLAATKPLPADRDLLAYAPAGSPFLDATLAGSGAALSARLEQDALRARLFLPRPNAPGEVRAFEKVDAPELTWMLDARSVVRARLAVDPSRFAGIWQRYVPGRVNLALSAAGVDVDQQVLGNAKPGAVAELTVAEGAQLGAGLPSLDLRRTNPLRYVQLFAAVGLKNPKAAEALVDQIAQGAPRFGAQMQRTTVSNAPAWFTRYVRGDGVDVALVGDTLVLAGPRARMVTAIPQVQAGAKATQRTPLSSQDALTRPAVGFVVDLRQLAESIRALPSSAWGVGGFAIKATTLRWLDATHELTALEGGITGEQGGLAVDLALRLSAR